MLICKFDKTIVADNVRIPMAPQTEETRGLHRKQTRECAAGDFESYLMHHRCGALIHEQPVSPTSRSADKQEILINKIGFSGWPPVPYIVVEGEGTIGDGEY
jgi:hypothetical protein